MLFCKRESYSEHPSPSLTYQSVSSEVCLAGSKNYSCSIVKQNLIFFSRSARPQNIYRAVQWFMEGYDKEPGDTQSTSGWAEAGEKRVSSDSESNSRIEGGSGEGGQLAKPAYGGGREEEDEKKDEKEAADFINWLARRTGARPAVMKAVWMAVIQEAPAYLVEENKSINLGFAEIKAFPYRKNWKEVLHAKFPKLIPSLKTTPKELLESYLYNVGWDSEIFNTDLCEFNKEQSTIGWNLDISVNRQWYRVTGGYEKKKRASLGSTGYGKRFLGLVKSNAKKIFSFFAKHVTQTSIPCAAVRDGGKKRGQYLVSYVPKGKVRPTAPQGIPAFVVSDNREEQLKSPEGGDLQGEIKEVRPLPDIPYSVKDLWKQGDGK